MKKTRLIFMQIFLVLMLAVFSAFVHMSEKNDYVKAGAFGKLRGNFDFCDLADRLYEIVL